MGSTPRSALAWSSRPRSSEPEQHAERGEEDRATGQHGDDHGDQHVVRRGRLLDRQARQEDRVLRKRPAGDDRGHGDDRAVAGGLEAPRPDERERAPLRRPRRRRARARPLPVHETVVERVRVVVDARPARPTAIAPATTPGAERARAEAPLEVVVVRADGHRQLRYTAAR